MDSFMHVERPSADKEVKSSCLKNRKGTDRNGSLYGAWQDTNACLMLAVTAVMVLFK